MGLEGIALVSLGVVVLMISCSAGVKQETLTSICFPTQNQEFCENLLMSDKRTSSADLPLLSIISIQLTDKQAKKNHHTFQQLHDNATDVSIKGPLNKCVGIYKEMIGKIREAYQLSMSKRYKDISQLAQATKLAYKCENGIPLSYNLSMASSETMILTCQTSDYVNLYIARQL
ncbi:Pectinesterase inhibitor [Corchorus olitorius]|uniref:Pectinesterase inhibitor n=1 Tax=Corchorus olitorius TaxID=93759 RepID=A0A1R3KQP4_9ROSI|nr:Pectinesterase inhibitor [Corchorus olitorius]